MVTSPSALRKEIISEDRGSGSKRGTKAELSQNISALRPAPQEGLPERFSPSTCPWAGKEATSALSPGLDVESLLLPGVPGVYLAVSCRQWVRSFPRGGPSA